MMKIVSTIKHVIKGVDIDSLYKEIAFLESTIKKNNAKSNMQISHLESRIGNLNEELLHKKDQISTTESELNDVSLRLSNSNDQIASLEAQKKTLVEAQEYLTRENDLLHVKVNDRDKSISSLQEENTQLMEAWNRLQKEMTAITDENMRLNDNLRHCELDYSKGLQEIEKLKSHIKLIDGELDQKRQEVEQANKKINEIEMSYSKLQEENSKDRETLTNRMSEYDNRCNTLKNEIETLQKINAGLNNSNSLLETEKRKQNERIILLEKENAEMGIKLREFEEKVYALTIKTKEPEEGTPINDILNAQLQEVPNKTIEPSNNSNLTSEAENTENTENTENSNTIDNKDDSDKVEEDDDDNYEEQPNESIDNTDAITENDEKGNSETTNDKEEVLTTFLDTTEELDDVWEDDTLPYIHDSGLIPAEKLSIPEVYDIKEGKIINSKDFFSQNEHELILWRRNLQEEYLMGNARFICPECKQPVKISGHKLLRGKVCYFAHFKDSADCPYKTGTNRTKEEIERMKYSLVQESERHKQLKAKIASALQGEKSKAMGVENVECEKRINSDIPYLKWRRPDIYAEYNGRKYVFELQLSTTFVSVIVDRDIFYRLNDYNIIWIFNFDDNKEYLNLHNLMCKDIYYANKRNVFIFDADTEEKSKEKGELILKCRWLDENDNWSNDEYITLDMLQYDEEYHKPFIFDADKAYLEKHPEYIESRKKLETSREYLLKTLMKRQKQEEELEKRKDEERHTIQTELLNNDNCVELFRSGTKYGYHYEGVIIIPAKYTSAEEIREDGYAQVGFNRKIGLVRRDGKEIVPVEYKTIDIINNHHGVVMASYKDIVLWLGDEKITLSEEYDDKEQKIIIERNNDGKKYILQTPQYDYSYSQSYYGDHPICHKNFAGYSHSTLFTIVEESDFCIIYMDGLSYLISKNNHSVNNGSYSDIKSIGLEQLFIAKDINSNLYGVIDINGNVITDFKYAKLIPTESEFLIVQYKEESSTYGVIDYLGREFMTPQFEALLYLTSNSFAFRKDMLWGICDCMGNVLHEAEYTYIYNSENNLRASTLKSYSNKWEVTDNTPIYHDNELNLCLLDDKGEIVFTEKDLGHYRLRHSGELYSILSSDNIEVVDYCLSHVEFITPKTAIVKDTEGQSGLFVEDKCLFFNQCCNIEYLCEDVFRFIDNHGNIALGTCSGPSCDYLYRDIRPIDTGHFVACKGSGWGYYTMVYVVIDKTGKVVSDEFDAIGEFEDGFANATYKGRKGVIDTTGVMQENRGNIYGDYTLCEKFELYYFRNNENGVASEEFQSVKQLKGLFFEVRRINEKNVRLFSLETQQTTDNSFYNISHFKDNLFVAQTYETANNYLNNRNIYQIHKDLELLSSDKYESVDLLDNGFIALKKCYQAGYNLKTLWKIAKSDGTILNDNVYDSIIEANDYSFKVVIDGHEGMLDLNGDAIVEKSRFEDFLVLTHCFADYGLENTEGKVIIPLEQHCSSIELLEDSLIKVCKNNMFALYDTNGVQITEHKFSSLSYEDNNRYAIVENNIKGHIDSQGDHIESISLPIPEKGMTIFVIMEKYGLRDSNNNIIIMPEFSSINYLTRELLAVRKDSNVALYDVQGKALTEFKYSKIICNENGYIQATRNKVTGILDDNGNEIADRILFNGGSILSSFGEYSVVNEVGDIIIPEGYTNIELLDSNGIFALWKGRKVAISNIALKKTEQIYESVEAIGNDYYLVSRVISKKIRSRQTGYGYKGNPYTYYTYNITKERKYGVLDGTLRIVIPCKYSSISCFDDEQNIVVTNANGEKKSISLHDLGKKASNILELSNGMDYDAEVVSFMAIGIVVKIQNTTFIIHKKHLFKEKKDFNKGEHLVATFLGNDENGYPLWKTNPSYNHNEDNSIIN